LADMLLKVINFLAENGVVTGDAVDTYRDFTPDKPDKVVVLQEYGGLGTFQGSEGAQRRFQVSVRSSVEDPEWAKTKAWEVYNALIIPESIIDSRTWVDPDKLWGVLSAMNTPNKLRVDENNRMVYGFNVNIVTERD